MVYADMKKVFPLWSKDLGLEISIIKPVDFMLKVSSKFKTNNPISKSSK